MTRRTLLAALAAAPKSHIVTLSFDDGFKKSFHRAAEIYERHGMRACFNVIATGHTPEFEAQANPGTAEIRAFPRGDFADWNALRRRGHEVMAHTYDHSRLTELPVAEAKQHIDRCAAYFEKHLRGFRAAQSVYSFAYNASTPELEEYALSKFLVIRTRGNAVNPIPTARRATRVGCISRGPANCDGFVEDQVNKFLASPGGWFVFNSHGLDEEGWGPMSSAYLDSLLARLKKLQHVDVLPVGEVVLRLKPDAR
jgi:peptidoglycan/xylan/chitin deacetylase (PgdA/CDA1 family)